MSKTLIIFISGNKHATIKLPTNEVTTRVYLYIDRIFVRIRSLTALNKTFAFAHLHHPFLPRTRKIPHKEDSDSSGEESMDKRPKIGDNLAALSSSSYNEGETTIEEDHMEEILSEHESESTSLPEAFVSPDG